MEVPTKISGEQPAITVLLSDKFEDIYKDFHCVVCGNIVFQYNEENIRSIIPSGAPKINKAGRIIRCNGVMSLHGTSQLYDVLYQIIEASFNLQSLDEIHTAVAYISKINQDKFNARCKARYFIS